jgi:mono/diheme cytochrome c family protein
MKIFVVIFCGVSIASSTVAQTSQPSTKRESRLTTRSAADVVPLPSSKALTSVQAAGKRLFVQRCSVCHLPALPSYTAYGPLLNKAMVADRGDEAVRLQIMQGSPRMPGFQYTLSPKEIDQLVVYLKTLDVLNKE